MGIKERREREREYVRLMIIKIVNQIVAKEGWSGVTIRKVAEKIEYSPPIIYEHFDSKEAIFIALIREAFSLLNTNLQESLQGVSDPLEVISKIVEVFYDFSIANRGYAKVIFGIDGVPCFSPSKIPEWQTQTTFLSEKLAVIMGVKSLDDPKIADAVHYVRWILRGAISASLIRLYSDEKLLPYSDHEKMKVLIARSIRSLLAGIDKN